MKLSRDPQDRIRLILAQIEKELSKARQNPPKKDSTSKTPATLKLSTSNELTEEDIELSNAYRQRALKAHKQNKIFTIHGNYTTIRKSLIRRGWVEKLTPGRLQKLQNLSFMRLIKGSRKGNDFEIATLSKIVQPYHANFIWQPKYLKDQYSSVNPLRNRVQRSRCLDFSTKVGLIGCFENSHWNTIENVAETVCLPSYKLKNKDDELSFLQEFRITQCVSVLAYLMESEKPSECFEKDGMLPVGFIEQAIEEVKDYCVRQEADFINTSNEEEDLSKWDGFAANCQDFINQVKKINGSEAECVKILKRTQEILERVKVFKPFLHSYGFRNLWILKPGFQCRGQGIVIMNNFYKIVNYAAARPKSNYIVQKYIEKPLLIYKTKFDIRQYMVVAIFDQISIWMYKDCYLRFSSREFSLADLGEAVHLTNNSIQKKYKNGERDTRLPKQNMWHLAEFRSYLAQQQNGDTWDDKIYPGFKKTLIAIVLASLEETELTKNTFEMYGCDFMLDEKLNPFLIEINSTPDLSPSTAVTAKICPAAMEDLMKVVLDHTKNPKAATGKFELVYKLAWPKECNNARNMEAIGVAKQIHEPPVMPSRKSKIKKFLKRKILRKPSQNMKGNKNEVKV